MHLQTVPLGIRDQVQASTVIAVEAGANWINGGYMAYQYDEFGRPVLGGQYLADVGTGQVQDNRVAGFTPGAGTVLGRNDQGQLVTNAMRIGGGSAARKQPAFGFTGGASTQAVGPAAGAPASPSIGSPGGPAAGGNFGSPSGGGLVQDVNLGQYQQNPYLSQMGNVLTNRVTDNLNRNIMPGIRSNAVMAGGFGGSRQGVVEANAMKDANQGISDALTGAYFQDFTNQMNRNLAQYGQNQNFYSNQRGQDLQQTQLGANLFNMGNQGFLSQGQGIYGLGSQQQQAPWQVVNNGNAGFGQWSGYGTTTSANQGGGAQGVLGGALAGGQLGSLWGGAGVSSPVSTPQPLNANYSLSTGGGLGLQAPSGWGV